MINFDNFNSLIDLVNYFTTEEKCKDVIIESRWGAGYEQDVVCPNCGRHHCSRRTDGRFECSSCHHNFSCTVGTIFENTKISLKKWFIAMYLISSHKKGVSACQIQRDVNVCYKTAWFMLQKIRTLFAFDDSVVMEGEIELDEVYIGGKEKWKHKNMKTPNTQGRSVKTKTPVFGMMERTAVFNEKTEEYESFSIVKALVVEKTAATLVPIIQQFCADGSRLITDELSSYNCLDSLGYKHDIVCHSESEYVNDDVFTNDIEGFWSHFRRMIGGCYHNVSVKYLQRYIDEACYRWNTRNEGESVRFNSMFEKSIGVFSQKDVKSVVCLKTA